VSKYDELFRTINSWFNKISDDNFDTMVENMISVIPQLDSLIALEKTIELLYEKAILSKKYSTLYGDFCAILINQDKFPYFYQKDTNTLMNFRRTLIKKCQIEFEEKSVFEVKGVEITEEFKMEIESKRKVRLVGNITFIGELYLRDILQEMIIFFLL